MREEIRDISTYFADYLLAQEMNPDMAYFFNLILNVLVVGALWILLHFLTKKIILKSFKAFTNRTKTTFDDFLVKSNFPRYVSNILPLLLLIFTVPIVFEEYPQVLGVLESLIDIFIIFLCVLICRSLLRSTTNFMKMHERFNDKPIESYTQVLMIIFWGIGFVLAFSEITDRSIEGFLISLGAASAVILFIFKDTILGFVASIQVSVNDIVRIGDWITFSKYGADGFVTEINLATVRVQNWDKTYTTIPTYSLISESFHNWRGMLESPGRRIKRSIFIKQSSVRFITSEDLERFSRFSLIAPYLEQRQKEIDQYNATHKFDRSTVINGRNQTNLGIFRKYVDAYLHAHPLISKELFVMARLLSPTTEGIPLEIYCFSSDKRWAYHEEINADIFEHLIAALPYFDLKIFESPSGDDIAKAIAGLQQQGKATN